MLTAELLCPSSWCCTEWVKTALHEIWKHNFSVMKLCPRTHTFFSLEVLPVYVRMSHVLCLLDCSSVQSHEFVITFGKQYVPASGSFLSFTQLVRQYSITQMNRHREVRCWQDMRALHSLTQWLLPPCAPWWRRICRDCPRVPLCDTLASYVWFIAFFAACLFLYS